jgi:hypothetical protein
MTGDGIMEIPNGLADLRSLMMTPPEAGGGSEVLLTPNAPAAGAGFTYTPAQGFWEVVTKLDFSFAASIVVANRSFSLAWLNADGRQYAHVPVTGTIAASGAAQVYLDSRGSSVLGALPGSLSQWMPAVILKQGYKLVLTVAGEDVADQVTVNGLTVQRFDSYTATGTARWDWEARMREMIAEALAGR